MIELKNKKLITKNDFKYYQFGVFADDKLISKRANSEYDNDDKVSIDLEREFDFEWLTKKLGQCEIKNLVSYNKEPIPFVINDVGKNYYDWEKLFFPNQFLYVKGENQNYTIGFDFYLNTDELLGWIYKYSPKHVLRQLSLINYDRVNILLEDDDWGFAFKIELKKEFTTTLLTSYNELKKAIYEVEQELYKRLESFKWKEDYHTDEPKFTKEVMLPLLKKMKYKNVRYNHGTDEYGRDVIFSEINKFQEEIFYGIQVKAGDISGGANSQIDTLIAQLDDAFRMPFKLLGDEHERYLSFFIIAISGHYKKNAKEKILKKVPQAYKQHIFFWDKDSIEDLTGIYWKEN